MYKILIISLGLFYLLPASGQPVNHALLVAVDKYPAGSGWAEIHAVNDIALIKPMLSAHGFTDRNTVVLTNEAATKKAIIRELERLIENTRAGDHLYIHFSCHGQQMADDNGDEPDGLDEAIIPYDARRRFESGVYEGENHLRDDDLEALLDRIRAKSGPRGRVVLVVDACHSGTADRDTDEDIYVRGTTYIFAPPGFAAAKNDHDATSIRIKSGRKLSPITILAACMPDQLNYEYHAPEDGRYYGSLTYALCGIMSVGAELPYDVLCRELEDRIAKQNPKRSRLQTPLLETTHENETFRIGR